jgi:hypothetical protein
MRIDENDPFNANCHEARNAQPMRLDAISKDGLGAATPHDFQKVALEKLDQQIRPGRTISLFITALAMKNAVPRSSCPSFRITELYQRMMERQYLRTLVSAGSRFENTVSGRVSRGPQPRLARGAVPNELAISSAMPALLAAFNNLSVVGGSAALFASISRQSGKA